MRKILFAALVISLLPLGVSAYSVSCSGIPDASSCQQCFHFDLASSNAANDIFVPRGDIPSGQQEYIDLSRSTVTGTAYQGASVSPTGTITNIFDTFGSGPNSSASWVWAKTKSGQNITRGTIPSGIDFNNPVYAIKYKTVSSLKDQSGNTVSGTEVTHYECGFFYASAPTQTTVICGNGVREGSEQCDDGNTSNSDSCSNSCLNNTYTNYACGNGIREGSEQCDDGNSSNTDGCSNTCATLSINQNPQCRVQAFDSVGVAPLKTTLSCSGDPQGRTVILITKNNTLINTAEVRNQDYTFSEAGNYTVRCYPDAANNQGNSCTTVVTINGTCGNSIIESGEMCDDGNRISGDSCDQSCRLTNSTCGNGYHEQGEQCDDGNNHNNDSCTNICQANTPQTGPTGAGLLVIIMMTLGLGGFLLYRRQHS